MNTKNSSSNPKDAEITVEAKERNTNPINTRIRVEESKELGNENHVGARSPNPCGTGNRDIVTKERIVDWVQRRFGTTNEALNVTLINSCQEVSSQYFPESAKSTRATRNGRSLWSDGVQVIEDNYEANNSPTIDDQRDNTHEDMQIKLTLELQ